MFQVIRLGALATLFWILDGRQETPSIPQFETRGESEEIDLGSGTATDRTEDIDEGIGPIQIRPLLSLLLL